MRAAPTLTAVALCFACAGQSMVDAQTTPSLDPAVIERAAGTRASQESDGVVRIGWTRDDVAVIVDGGPLPPSAGLGSWAAFKAASGGAIVMGDAVLFEDEITPAMDAALAHGLRITALHNHFIFDRPPVFYMHIEGVGAPASLAAGVKAMWDAARTVRRERPKPADRFAERPVVRSGHLNIERLKTILGGEPAINNGAPKFTWPRAGKMHGVEIGASMGLSTWAAFTGDDASASVDGDFIMTADEVQAVIRALREGGIHIVALHNHMIGEDPPFLFLHYWGVGQAEQLALGVRKALATQSAAR